MNPKTECHCRVTCPMPDGDAYEGDHVITLCEYHKRIGRRRYTPIVLTEKGWRQTDIWKWQRSQEVLHDRKEQRDGD